MDDSFTRALRGFHSGDMDAGLEALQASLHGGFTNERYIEIAAAYGHPICIERLGYQPTESQVLTLEGITTLPFEFYARRSLAHLQYAAENCSSIYAKR